MAIQRPGAAQAHLPRGHQADPEKLPQSGSSVLQFSTLPKLTSLESTNTCLCAMQVIILDPVQDYAAELLSVAEMFYANNIPLRFAFGDTLIFYLDERRINTCTVRVVTCKIVLLLSAASVCGMM